MKMCRGAMSYVGREVRNEEGKMKIERQEGDVEEEEEEGRRRRGAEIRERKGRREPGRKGIGEKEGKGKY